MNEPTTTYSLELLGFPGASDPAQLPALLAEAFGIQEEEARRIVDGAPLAVKKGADAESARRLAKVLLSLGAELCIRNEKTGEERIQRAPTSAPAPDPGEKSQPNKSPVEGTTIELGSKKQPEEKHQAAGMPVPAAPASWPPRPIGAAKSVPPPKSVRAPPTPDRVRTPLDICVACARPIDKGSHCLACGWSNKEGKRHCRECGRRLSVSSNVFRKRGRLAAISAPILVGAGVAAYFFGVFPAGVLLAAFAAGLVVADGTTMAYRCRPCSREIDASALRPAERKVLVSKRSRGVLVGVLCALVAGAMTLPVFATTRELQVDSFGMSWRAKVPVTHRGAERRTAMVNTPLGDRRLIIRKAMNDRFPVESFLLMHIAIPDKALSSIDDPQLEPLIARSLDAAIGGGVVLSKLEAVSAASGPARETTFEATLQGRKVGGKVRALVFDDDVVLVAFVATGQDAANKTAGTDFFASVETLRGN